MRIPDLDEKLILYLRHHTGALAFAALACATAYSAVVARAQTFPTVREVSIPAPSQVTPIVFEQTIDESSPDVGHRWFNAREVRPARVIWMTVTAYTEPPTPACSAAPGQRARSPATSAAT